MNVSGLPKGMIVPKDKTHKNDAVILEEAYTALQLRKYTLANPQYAEEDAAGRVKCKLHLNGKLQHKKAIKLPCSTAKMEGMKVGHRAEHHAAKLARNSRPERYAGDINLLTDEQLNDLADKFLVTKGFSKERLLEFYGNDKNFFSREKKDRQCTVYS